MEHIYNVLRVDPLSERNMTRASLYMHVYTLEMLDTIRIGSTPTFLYFDL